MATFLGYSNFNGRNGDKFSADLLYDIIEKNIAENYSVVRLYGYIRSWGYSGSGAYAPFYINGVNSGGFSSIIANQYSEVARRDIRIDHNTVGEANLDWSFLVDTNWTLGDASANGSVPLPTIPRTSSVTCTDGKIESSISININRASDTFSHNLRYAFGSLSGTIANGISTAYGWTIPATFYSQIPNSKNGHGTIYCDTYSNGDLIGTSSCILKVETDEEKCKPVVTANIIDTNEEAIALTGDENKLIRFISNPKVTAVAKAKNSSTISSIKVECADGKSGSGNEVILNKIENGKFTISANDSRGYVGYTNPNPIEKEMIPYIPLTLNATFERVEPTTGEVRVTYNGNYYNGSFGEIFNSLNIKYRYKQKSNSEWSEYIILSPVIDEENNRYSQTIKLEESFDYQKAYDFEIVAEDKLKVSIQEGSITEGIPMLALFKDNIEMFGNKVYDSEGNLYLPGNTSVYSGDNKIINHDTKNNETIIATNESNIVLRPNGINNKDGQMFIDKNGSLHFFKSVSLISNGLETFSHNSNTNATVVGGGDNGIVILRPNGCNVEGGQCYIDKNGNASISGAIFSQNFYQGGTGNKAVLTSNVNVLTMMSQPYLEIQTLSINGTTAWGINVWASDKRLKNSIKNTKVNALDIIKQIKHREFKYNNNDNLVKIGYVADELQKIDEEMVFEVGEDKLKQPKESYIIPLLSKAIQEQQEQIDNQNKLIKELLKRVENLESKVIV